MSNRLKMTGIETLVRSAAVVEPARNVAAVVESARNVAAVAQLVRNVAGEQLRNTDAVVEPGSVLDAFVDTDSMERPSELVDNTQFAQLFAVVEHELEPGKIFEGLRRCKLLN